MDRSRSRTTGVDRASQVRGIDSLAQESRPVSLTFQAEAVQRHYGQASPFPAGSGQSSRTCGVHFALCVEVCCTKAYCFGAKAGMVVQLKGGSLRHWLAKGLNCELASTYLHTDKVLTYVDWMGFPSCWNTEGSYSIAETLELEHVFQIWHVAPNLTLKVKACAE